ncbi:hypothetical protein OG500_23795 [Kitasatospora sp. NBC_01250]|uniref:hypothetical protein n=1 Tax=unclassified Kitasatospora TaxID=2633591 RepID=UPI002E0D6D24|nr:MULTISPECIES: hypothetical protein [unclassified Kitasatospora]WSJ69165.1 hypothetical protein OG294_25340 [Kitasatospora sp. NBC_01302]
MKIQLMNKVTGQTAVAASRRPSVLGACTGGVSLSGVRGGLDLDATRVAAVGTTGALRTSVLTGAIAGTAVETGLSHGWAMVAVGSPRVMRDDRPTKAPKSAGAAAKQGAYLQVVGAAPKQDEQLINQAKAAFIGAEAIRSRAFRGPEPWRERT